MCVCYVRWIDADTYDCHTPGYGVLPECEEDAPTLEPTPGPTDTPQTEGPTNEPTVAPTNGPTVAPTQGPTDAPTAPTQGPTDAPTAPTAPTETPTPAPTASTEIPTAAPSNNPTSSETDSPATDTPVETTTWTVVVTSVLSDLTLNEWDDSTEELYINGLSTSLDIPISRISILSVTSGSIVVESEVTDFQDAASAEAVVSVAADPDAFTFDESLGAVEVEISDPVEVTVESSEEETDSEPGSNPLTLISGATRGVDSHEHSVSMVIGVVMGTGLLRR